MREAAFEELTKCMRCGQGSSTTVDVIGNLTMFWRGGGAYGVWHPAFCTECMDDIKQFAETPITRTPA